MAQMY